MAKVKIQGHASGTGVLTVTAPNTSTDRTITLPDSTGTILDNTSTLDATKLSGNLPAISGANLTGITQGITEFDQWRITSDLALSSSGRTVMTANWERSDTNFDKIGTGMSESSGIFTFPSTGKWLVTCTQAFSSSTDMAYCWMEIQNTTDNSSYDRIAKGVSPSSGSGEDNHSASFSTMIDVTNVSNDKVCFSAYRGGSVTFLGSSAAQITGVTFMKLGDT